jgi:tetratricopeptide (TPR) repeat protein
VTYPDSKVAELLNTFFVPVQVNIQEVSKLADQYQAIWTPNLNVIDGRENRVYHVEGWLPPSEFAAMLETARGQYCLRRKRFEDAAPIFKGVFEKYPRSAYAPESLYYRGVSRYLATHNVNELKEDWIMLQRFYPDDAWAMKANII